MHLSSNENVVTLYFPFGFNSQEKYGITSSATSKSWLQREERERESNGEGGGVRFILLLCTPLPPPALWQVTGTHCRWSYELGRQPNYLASTAIHPSRLTLLPAVPQHISITNFPLEVVLSQFSLVSRVFEECLFSGGWMATDGTAAIVCMCHWSPGYFPAGLS